MASASPLVAGASVGSCPIIEHVLEVEDVMIGTIIRRVKTIGGMAPVQPSQLDAARDRDRVRLGRDSTRQVNVECARPTGLAERDERPMRRVEET